MGISRKNIIQLTIAWVMVRNHAPIYIIRHSFLTPPTRRISHFSKLLSHYAFGCLKKVSILSVFNQIHMCKIYYIVLIFLLLNWGQYVNWIEANLLIELRPISINWIEASLYLFNWGQSVFIELRPICIYWIELRPIC